MHSCFNNITNTEETPGENIKCFTEAQTCPLKC